MGIGGSFDKLTEKELAVLAHIRRHDPPVENAGQVGGAIGVPLPEARALIDHLRAQGLIEWIPGFRAADRREPPHWELTRLGTEAVRNP